MNTNTTAPDTIGFVGKQMTALQKRWLLAFDCYNLSTNILFTSAIWVIYLAAHGYDPFAIGLFEMVFHIAKFLAEVPTGIFADMLGRRKSLIIYCVLSALESLLFLVPGTPFLVLAFILSGTAIAFRAGANDALLWNLTGTTVPQEQAARYSKLVSRMFLLGLIGEVIGTASGGYLGNILQILPFICRAVVVMLGIVPLLLIPEQRSPRQVQERVSPLRHLRQGLRAVWQSPVLLGLLLISGLTESCWQTIYFYYQLYLHSQGFSLFVIGLVVSISMLTNFVFTALTPFFMRHLPQRWLLPLFVGCEIAGLFMMCLPWSWISVVGYLLLFQAGMAVLFPALSTYINERCPEEQRATVLSFQTGLFSAAMIVLFPLFGLGLTHSSYSTVYLWTLLVLTLGSVLIGVGTLLFKRYRNTA